MSGMMVNYICGQISPDSSVFILFLRKYIDSKNKMPNYTGVSLKLGWVKDYH